MPQKLANLALTGLLLLPAAANASEVMIRCELVGTSKLDGEVIEEASTKGTRYYVFDDTSQKVWGIFDGVRKELCLESNCRFSLTPMMLTIVRIPSASIPSTTETKIDRLTGKLTETSRLPNTKYGDMDFRFEGSCVPAALEQRRF